MQDTPPLFDVESQTPGVCDSHDARKPGVGASYAIDIDRCMHCGDCVRACLFGAIAAQGIAIMIEKKVDMFSSKNIAVIASIMVIGIGGQYAFGGNIPFFGLQVPCIAGAAIFGIVLNLLLSIGEKKAKAEKE